jgi:hypothetical protein
MSSPVQPILDWSQWLPHGLNALENGMNRMVPDSVLQYLHLMAPQAQPMAVQQSGQVANQYANQRLSDAMVKRIRERAAQAIGGQ